MKVMKKMLFIFLLLFTTSCSTQNYTVLTSDDYYFVVKYDTTDRPHWMKETTVDIYKCK